MPALPGDQPVAAPYSARATVADGEPPLGVGRLRSANNDDDFYYDWPRVLVLPLWTAPDATRFAGWLAAGRFNGAGTPFVLTGAGLVETAYEQLSFIVHEVAGDGWYRLRLTPGQDAWAHRCHLVLSRVRLAYESWETFLTAHGDWLHFRRRVPHALRAAPSADAANRGWIGNDHKLELREITGDWMRVAVTEPDPTCMSDPPPEAALRRREGWVRWRDADSGPWVWIYTRGC